MSRIAYFDCFSGISGDMTLGALVDAGLPLEALQEGLAALNLPEFTLQAKRVTKQGISATELVVAAQEGHVHRGLREIVDIIKASSLPDRVTELSLKVFQVLAQAEAAIHGTTPEHVHFHEVGAVDAIVDIVGACFGLTWFGIDKLYCSPLPTGGGQVHSAHGIIPVPAPATLALIASRSVPVYDNGQRIELVTPTGAALMVALADGFGGFPSFAPDVIGYGAGKKALSVANVLRIVIGEEVAAHTPPAVPNAMHTSQHQHGHVHHREYEHVHDDLPRTGHSHELEHRYEHDTDPTH